MTDWNKSGAIATIIFGVVNALIGIAGLVLMSLSLNRSLPIAWWMPSLIALTVVVSAVLFYRASRSLRGEPSTGPEAIDNWLTRLADNEDRHIETAIRLDVERRINRNTTESCLGGTRLCNRWLDGLSQIVRRNAHARIR